MAINILTALKTEQQNCGSLLDAEVLLAAVLKTSREYLRTWPEKELTQEELNSYLDLVARKVKGEPIAYILGTKEFWSLSLKVSEAVLIPRPETEMLVQLAIEKGISVPGNKKILELGTGSGAVALALAKECSNFQITAVDISEEALLIAKQNAINLTLSQIEFLKSDWFSYFSSKKDCESNITFDIIVGNPPYISPDDIHLLQGGLSYEPKEALISKQEGYYDLKKIIEEAPRYMASKGWLMLEHGASQGKTVRSWMSNCGLFKIQCIKDMAGLDRVSIGQKP